MAMTSEHDSDDDDDDDDDEVVEVDGGGDDTDGDEDEIAPTTSSSPETATAPERRPTAASTAAASAASPRRCLRRASSSRCRRVLLTPVPIRPRSRGERRSLRTFNARRISPPITTVSIPDLRRLSTPTDAFQLHPDVASYGPQMLAALAVHLGQEGRRRRREDEVHERRRKRKDSRRRRRGREHRERDERGGDDERRRGRRQAHTPRRETETRERHPERRRLARRRSVHRRRRRRGGARRRVHRATVDRPRRAPPPRLPRRLARGCGRAPPPPPRAGLRVVRGGSRRTPRAEIYRADAEKTESERRRDLERELRKREAASSAAEKALGPPKVTVEADPEADPNDASHAGRMVLGIRCVLLYKRFSPIARFQHLIARVPFN